jgi:alpha-ketoglutaric semialdehyde dehydrogenase
MTDCGCLIDGYWVVPTGADLADDVSPADRSDVIGRFVQAPATLVEEAVSAAKAALPGWAQASPQTRSNLLEAVAARIFSDADELATLLAREEGKTRAEAKGEVLRAAHLFRFFSGEALRMTGERQMSTREGVAINVHREPIGVVGVITPWNFPIAIASWKVAPALAFGNTVVHKPAELVPATATALARIIEQVGFPPGVYNLVTGRGSVVGDAIVTNEEIDAITFTGSEEVGQQVAEKGAGRRARVQLEMGGKNPLVVLADADLDVAVEVAIDGSFYQTGQRCTASSRLVVEDSIHDVFVERMLTRMKALTVGHSLDPQTIIGPVVDDRQLKIDLTYLDLARGTPGSTVFGGECLELSHDGFYLSPALICGLDNAATVNREEIFGPVTSVIRVSDYEEAVAVANDTAYGLAAGICTTSLRYAEDFQMRSQSGMVMVNLPTAGVDAHVPFGGRKGSSYGPREQGSYARHFFTQSKTAYIRP